MQRVVVKQIGKQKPRERGAFVKGQEWDSNYPLEVELMRALKNKNNIVQIRGYRRYPEKEVHRIYMEYCLSGDLYGLISQYRARRQVNQHHERSFHTSNADDIVANTCLKHSSVKSSFI